MFGTLLKFAGIALLGGIGIAVAAIAIDAFLDENTLSEEVHKQCPEALKCLIQEKKANAVKVGIFNSEEETIESSIEISSSKGVSDNLQVGQEIYL